MNTYRSLKAIQQALQAGEISCLSLTQSYLTRIQEQHKLNAFLEVFRVRQGISCGVC